MNNFIENIVIKNLFHEKDISWDLERVNVLVGKNGLGKSTILRLIDSAVTQNPCDDWKVCDEVSVKFNDNNYNTIKKDIKEFKKYFEKLNSSGSLSELIEKTIKNNNLAKELNPEIIEELKKQVIDEFNKELKSLNEKNIGRRSLIGYSLKGDLDSLKTEFISTINMSANSINHITTSSGKDTTLLDIEIDSEIKRLISNCKNRKGVDLKLKLTSALNNFFEETNKKIYFDNDSIKIISGGSKKLQFQNLSSGERQIIFIFLKVLNGSIDRSLILMDEPEISLHLSWQEKLLDEIIKINKSSQIIIVTHSPAIVMNGWFDCLTDIKDIFIENNASSEVI